MHKALTFTLAQLNPTVGDIGGNADKILDVWRNAESDLVVFPELFLCGYPPEDLVLKPAFMRSIEDAIAKLCEASQDFSAAALISCPWIIDEKLHNVMHIIEHGKIIATQAKHHLPNVGVFDEKRVFTAGRLPDPVVFRGGKLGVLICEDMWHKDVAAHLKAQGAESLVVTNASPYARGKYDLRLKHAKARVQETGLALVFVNQIGGQDELVFDGGSFALNAQGACIQQLAFFEENVARTDAAEITTIADPLADIYAALVLGLKDYIQKNDFPGVLLGLSGGVDSALAAVIAADAIGAQKVQCVMMPSPYTSQDSLDDAAELAKNLGCAYESVSIGPAMTAFEGMIEGLSGVAHENMQSRSRALVLMALSNSNGKMVLSTGNKSEMAVGYATLYGDMCGGFNALKDVYKTTVYELCEWRNAQGSTPVIPQRIITKAPTAELKDNQSDQDSLPPYDVLDDILEGLIEGDMSVEEIAARGHDAALIRRIWRMLDRAEYKRRQAPPGVKITTRNFGRDRRYPITNDFVKQIEK